MIFYLKHHYYYVIYKLLTFCQRPEELLSELLYDFECLYL